MILRNLLGEIQLLRSSRALCTVGVSWVCVSPWVTVRKSTEDLAEILRKQLKHTLTHLWFSEDWDSTKLLMNCYCTGNQRRPAF